MKSRSLTVIGQLIHPYRWIYAGILAITVVTSLLEGINVAVFFPMVQALLDDGASSATSGEPFKFFDFIFRFLPFQDPIVSVLALLAVVTVVRVAFQMLQTALTAYASGTVQYDLKNRLLEKYSLYPYSFFLEAKPGHLLYNASAAVGRVGILYQKIPQFVSEALKAFALAAIFVMVLRQAALILGVVSLAYLGLTRFLSGKVSYHIGKARAVSGAAQASIATEFFTGIRQIRLFGTESSWLSRFREQSRIFSRLFMKDSVWVALPKALLELVAVMALLGSLLYFRMVQGESLVSSLPVMAVFAVGLLRFLPSLTMVGQLRMEIVGLLADAELVHEVMAQPVPASSQGGRPFTGLHRGISLENLQFTYPARVPLFDGIRVEFVKGKTTALVGSSGSGKSTLAYLLLGLLEPTGGKILVDGVALTELEKRSWRSRIGFVSQDMFISHATVRENILFGRSGFSETQIRRATDAANAGAFIDALPMGMETMVGERGMKLSGGQQQRISIARAILHDPEILIFDEATSFLDTESERLVQEALERISKDRTVILIAHRLSTIQNADRIIVLEGGRVVEQGTHADLIRGEGRYFQLATTKSREIQ